MNTTDDRFTLPDSSGIADVQQHADRAFRQFAFGLAVYFVIALGTMTWLVVSSSALDVSAASDVMAQPAPTELQVPYFPSLYVNQATDVEPPPPTF